jgi:thioesterase domain-containing protein
MYEMTQQLEAAGEGIDFMMVLDQPMSELPGFPADLNKAALIGELLNIARDYYEGFRVLEAPYPNWGPALMARLGSLPFAGLVPYLSAFMKEKYPHKEPTIEYVSRLINIRLYNSSIGYQPCGEIESEVIVLNALRAREVNDDETLGWSACARNLKSLVIDGNHHDIVWGNNVVKVTEYIKKRIGSNHLP